MITNQTYTNQLASAEFNNGVGWITFFTPSYNRANRLHLPYNSLKRQTDKHFVWIFVNDGSTDNTIEVVKDLMSREEIPIAYIQKTNGGKHSAFKAALAECATEYFVCMDDDDEYSEKSVEAYLSEWRNIEQEKDETIGAIRALSQYEDGTYVSSVKISDEMLGSHLDITTLDYNYKKKIKQENWTCYKTVALRSVDLFPTSYLWHEKHKFFTESIWQGRFARKYKCRYLYIPLRKYLFSEVSLSRPWRTRQNFIDIWLNAFLMYTEQYDYISKYCSVFYNMKVMLFISILRSKLEVPFDDFVASVENEKLKRYFRLFRLFAWASPYPRVPKH